jgi:short-subunit dehydrogenase
VVCPGLTATEFHFTTGAEPVPGERERVGARGMSAEDVVTASLAGLERGEVVCVPGLSEPEAVTRLAEAELDLRTASAPELAARYATR